jgi:hypothetical protein
VTAERASDWAPERAADADQAALFAVLAASVERARAAVRASKESALHKEEN